MTLRGRSDSEQRADTDRGPRLAQRATVVLAVLGLVGALVAGVFGAWFSVPTLLILVFANVLTNRSLAWTRETRRREREERR